MLKRIGTAAREDLERFFGIKVFLELRGARASQLAHGRPGPARVRLPPHLLTMALHKTPGRSSSAGARSARATGSSTSTRATTARCGASPSRRAGRAPASAARSSSFTLGRAGVLRHGPQRAGARGPLRHRPPVRAGARAPGAAGAGGVGGRVPDAAHGRPRSAAGPLRARRCGALRALDARRRGPRGSRCASRCGRWTCSAIARVSIAASSAGAPYPFPDGGARRDGGRARLRRLRAGRRRASTLSGPRVGALKRLRALSAGRRRIRLAAGRRPRRRAVARPSRA